jgi:hypothetical protein
VASFFLDLSVQDVVCVIEGFVRIRGDLETRISGMAGSVPFLRELGTRTGWGWEMQVSEECGDVRRCLACSGVLSSARV